MSNIVEKDSYRRGYFGSVLITQFENGIREATVPLPSDLVLGPHGAGHFRGRVERRCCYVTRARHSRASLICHIDPSVFAVSPFRLYARNHKTHTQEITKQRLQKH